jgi:hypothetical protein
MGFNNISVFTVIWFIASISTLIYLVRNFLITKELSDLYCSGAYRNIYKRILTIRQYERELLLVFLHVLLSLLGSGAVILPPPLHIATIVFVTIVIPALLVFCCGLLAYHSYRIHTDHDEVLELSNNLKNTGSRD